MCITQLKSNHGKVNKSKSIKIIWNSQRCLDAGFLNATSSEDLASFFRFFCAGHVGPNRSMLTSPSSTPLPLLTSLALGWEVLVRKSFHKKGTTMVARVYWWKSEIVSYSFLNHTCFTSQPDSIFTMTSPSHVLATLNILLSSTVPHASMSPDVTKLTR